MTLLPNDISPGPVTGFSNCIFRLNFSTIFIVKSVKLTLKASLSTFCLLES